MERREKGSGNIFEYPKSSGRKKRFRVKVTADGTTTSKCFATEAEAKRFLRDHKAKERLLEDANTTNVNFSTFSVVFLDDKKRKLKVGSYETLEGTINIINAHIGNLALKSCDNNTLQKLIYTLADLGYSRSSLSKVSNNVKAMLKMAASRKVIARLPVFDITIPQPKTQEEISENSAKTNCFTEEEMKAYEDEAIRMTVSDNKYTKHYGEKVLVHVNGWKLRLLLHTGLRIGELLALEWSDYDEKSKTLKICKNIRQTKGGKITQTPKTEAGNRIIVLNKSAYEDLKNLKKAFQQQSKDIAAREKAELDKAESKEQRAAVRQKFKAYKAQHKYICGSSRFPYGLGDANSLRTTHNKICDDIGLSHPVSTHGCRHSWATWWYLHHCNDENFDLATFSRSLGHRSLRVSLEVYSHLEMAEKQNKKRSVADLKDF